MTIYDNSIYIVPNNIKIDLLLDLSKEKKLKNIKFFSLEEIVNSYSSYDEEALYYLMKKYGYKYKNAKIILNNIRYVEDKEYDNEKINNLVRLKNELKEYHMFDEELFNVLKRDLESEIKTVIENSKLYANSRMFELLGTDAYSYHGYGYLEDLESINEKNLYDYYKEFITKSDIDIYVIGDFNEKEMISLIKK